jgi:hypothetical protein
MKPIIKQLLRERLLTKEDMVSNGNYDDFIEYEYTNLIVIAKDDNNKNEHFLVLSVNLTPINKSLFELTFGFSIHNIDLNKVGDYMYDRESVSKYLTSDLNGKIMPLVIKMMNNLIKRINPKSIEMQTFENLSGDSLKRYDKIIEMLINDFNYKLINTYLDKTGVNHWLFKNFSEEEIELNENNITGHHPKTTKDKIKVLNEYLDKTLNKESLDLYFKKYL